MYNCTASLAAGLRVSAISRFLVASGVICLIYSCASSKYVYEIKLIKPNAEKLFYENDTLAVSFNFKPKYIEFELYNKLEEGIRINWDEISIAINGQAKRVVHYETGTESFLETQPPTTIPPKSKLVDGFILSSSISSTRVSGQKKTVIADIYPSQASGFKKEQQLVMSRKGEKTIIFLPLYIRNQYAAKTFEFVIQDIQVKR